MKRFYVGNLREGVKIEDVFLVASKSIATTRNGSTYLRMRLADKTGEIEAVKWEITETETARLSEDDYIFVSATASTYRDSLQLTIDSFRKTDDDIDPADFLRCSTRDIEQMMTELRELLQNISNPHLKHLLRLFLEDDDFAIKFRQAPAAKTNHHACVGGLLEHTLSVTKMCVELAELYPQLDRDLLLTGAALHDIGKIEEFNWAGSIKYSEAGVLVGHLVGGAMMVKQAADKIDGFDPLLSTALQHLILSHHGLREYGSPKLPKSIEALALHCADDLDAKIAMFEQAIEESDGNGDNGLFTKRHFLLGHSIFKGHRRQDKDQEQKSNAEEIDLDLFTADYDPFADD